MRLAFLLLATFLPFSAAAQQTWFPLDEMPPSPQKGDPVEVLPQHRYDPAYPTRHLPVEGGGVPVFHLGPQPTGALIDRDTINQRANPLPVIPLGQEKEWISGSPFVVDGDSFSIDGVLVRMAGIDAPEVDQLCYHGNIPHRCGIEARKWLAHTIEDKRVDCRIHYIDAAQRAISTCWLEGKDINAWAVNSGWALVWEGMESPYAGIEEDARARQDGVWAFDFRHPAQWRTLTQAARDKTDARISSGEQPTTLPFPYQPFTERNGMTMPAPVYVIPER